MASMPTTTITMGNKTLVCQNTKRIITASIWHHGNPLKVPFSLFMLQFSVISSVSLLFDSLLRPIGQSKIVSQTFSGVVCGPSILGYHKKFADSLFPVEGENVLKTAAIFWLMYFLFVIGVKVDPGLMIRPGRKAMAIGFTVFIFSTTLPIGLSFILTKFVLQETSHGNSLLYIAGSQSLTAFPVIACLLTELKLLNTNIGRLALSSSMFNDIFGITMHIINFAVGFLQDHNPLTALWAVISTLALLAAIVFIFRPIMLWMLNQSPGGKPSEKCISSILVFVLVTGILSDMVGQHYVVGPLVLGFVVPEGPPLGAALESKLETIVSRLLSPLYLAVIGMETDIFKIHFRTLGIMGLLIVFAFIVKIIAVMLPAVYCNTTKQEAFVLGLILNAKGIIDLMMFSLWKNSQVLTEEVYSLAVLSVLAVTGIITPLIKHLYDPSSQYISNKRNTIQHSKHDSELRILICIHNQDNIPTIVNLLDVSHANKESPIAVIAMILVELIGRTTPLLVCNDGITETNTSATGHIVNALRIYEEHNQGNATVQSFTSISHLQTMYDDICQMARDKRATIVIMPFHKQWAIDGCVESINRAIQTLNINVLQKAPCSVGILVDRGILSGSFSVLTSQSLFQVAALFIGGQDDVESLSYAFRMARHESVRLIVIRFLQFGAENTKDRKRDSNFIDEFRRANMGNKRFEYAEEVVKDGETLATSLRGLVDCFDLILVGRYHQESPILQGLEAWSECPELGVIGDMLASPDFHSTASVLVVQQQRIRGKLMHRTVQPVVTDIEAVIHDVPNHEASRSENNCRLSISVDKN